MEGFRIVKEIGKEFARAGAGSGSRTGGTAEAVFNARGIAALEIDASEAGLHTGSRAGLVIKAFRVFVL